MKDEDVKIGMKVVPHDKTAGVMWTGSISPSWERAKAKGQPYLFVKEFLDNAWVLSDDKDGGGFFNASDFEPYEDLDRRIAKAERKLARLIAEREAEKLLPVGTEVWVRGKVAGYVMSVDKNWFLVNHYKVEFDDFVDGCRRAIYISNTNIKEVE